VAPLEFGAEIVREGRNIQLLEGRLLHDGKDVARASALKVRETSFEIPETARTRPEAWPRPDECPDFRWFKRAALGAATDIRTARLGEDLRDGRAAWFRLKRPFFADAAMTPVMRAAMTADYMNGLSAILDFEKWIFINGDLTVHFARAPEGEWTLLDAQTWVGGEGRGLAFGVLHDLAGPFGRATQSLMVAPRSGASP
jgi:hypothetical protein